MAYYNLEKLIRIVCNDKTKAFDYEMRPEKKSFWGGSQKAGVYEKFGAAPYIGTEAPENHVIEDGKVLLKMHVVLNFEGGYTHTKYYSDEKKLDAYVADIKRRAGYDWIKE